MIAYFDTSAIVPLIVAESGSDACRTLWASADELVACRLAFVETAAALAQALRLGRIGKSDHSLGTSALDVLWTRFSVIEIDDALMRQAAADAARFGLRGYDAVHCAAAGLVAGEETVGASGDRALLAAWASIGLATFDTASGPA